MIVRITLLATVSLALVAAGQPAHASLFGGGKKKAVVERQEWAPSPYVAPPAPPADGAIFHAAYGYAPLTSGARAAQVGDVLTIILQEKTQAQKSNSATHDRSGNIGVTAPTSGPLATILNKVNLNVGDSNKFDGKGGAEQSNSLTGDITVTIAQVFPNGTMMVRGEKQLTLNRGDEQIRISGIIRAADISYDNTVPSTRVADARITYTGKGEIARASTQGWLGRFFSRVAPF